MGSTMEVLQEEAIGMSHDHSHHIVKGRRTKRQRLLQPAVISSSSAGADDQNNTSSDENNVDSSNIMNSNYLPSPATSTGSTTEEEEDMANCLILLAQGRGGREDVSGRRLVEGPAAMTTTAGKTGLYVYECKTCNRCFPSFQALGGHRASHKKPKTMAVNGVEEESESNCLSLQLCKPIVPESGSKVRVHECSICGSEFSSGQALGGHMRRHRAAMAESSSQEISKKQKSLLLLDLNLPAPPEDDHRDFPKSPTRFSFAGKVQPLVFTASPLVDCHY